jgi:hypothetical protein
MSGAPGLARRIVIGLALAGLLTAVSPLQAQVSRIQRAIESLEGCSKQERKQGCVRILKRKSRGDGREAVKAQIRGGRIIWYEYDSRSGSVRRTN